MPFAERGQADAAREGHQPVARRQRSRRLLLHPGHGGRGPTQDRGKRTEIYCYCPFKKVIISFTCSLSFQSYPFHNPVNKKFVKDYYEIIKHPMDLASLLKVRHRESFLNKTRWTVYTKIIVLFQNVQCHKYKTQESFLDDLSLIVKNSEKYNGMDTALTNTARKLVEVAKQALAEVTLTFQVCWKMCESLYFRDILKENRECWLF